MKIIKRNGQEAQFDKTKISSAISKANKEVSGSDKLDKDSINTIADSIEKYASSCGRSLNVEEIQDMVEDHIMDLGKHNLARRYITYRYRRSIARKSNTTDDQILSLIDCNNEEIKQENSNKNPTVASVQRDYMAGEVSKDISRRILLPEDVVHAHDEGIIHFHDMDYYAQHMHNCDLINLEDMIQNGTVISGTMIEKPHSFSTACNVATQIIAQVASCQYGGQSITLSHLAPFVDVSRNKIRSEVESEILPLKDELADRFSEVVSNITEKRVREEIKRGVQTIQYQVVTLMTTNGQAPFITVFMYIDEVPEGRTREDLCLIIEEVLRQRIQGVKNEKGVWITPAFPKLIYCLDEDNVYPDSKYYYLTELAAKCTAKRMVPDYISAKKMKELKGDVYTCMGALAAKEHLYVRIDDNEPIDLSIKELFDYCYQHTDIVGRPAQLHFPKDRLNPNLNSANDCISADCEPNSGVYRITYIPEDVSYIGSTDNMRRRWTEHRWAIRNTGGIDGGMCFADNNLDNYLFEVIAYCDNYRQLETEYIMSEPNCNIRGTRNKLYKVSNRNLEPQYSRPNFTFKTRIPQCLIDISSLNIKVYDRGNKWTRIRNIFKNDKSNTPLMMEIRYIENGKKFSLSCTEDHPVWTGTKFTRADNLKVGEFLYRADGVKLPIVDIEWYSHPVDSYDISTETGTFIGSDIQMHNCRSFLTPDRFTDNGVGNIAKAKDYVPGKHKYFGRFNQGVVTINLVDVGLTAVNNLVSKDLTHADEAQHKQYTLDEFWSVLDERLELCHKALRCRHERLKGTLSDTCPILWQHGALARLNKGETIDRLLYDGYSTISLGYAGLWECVYALIGKKLTEYEGKELGLEIMRKLNEYTAKWKKAENIDYSLYGTPIESTTYRFAKCLQRRFGKVKGVTDKNYITNSYHVHVTEHIDAFSKLKLESEFQALSPGGAISYVEVPNMQNNIPAVLTVMKFIYDNIIYAELNTKSDYCQVCGYDGEIQIIESDGKLVWECPNCGNRDQTKMNVARRTCGYIGSQFWNQGRTQEIKERVLHL